MTTRMIPTTTATGTEIKPVDLKLEVVLLPVSDAERSKVLYECLGWRVDADAERPAGADPDQADYQSLVSFSDPDGNGWLLQEVRSRLHAVEAHGEHEARNGGEYDEEWPEWYAAYMVAGQAGTELPT